MRLRGALLLGLLAGLVAGCTAGKAVRPAAWLNRFRPFQGPTGPDVVQMDVALIERPVGDRYINDDLWTLADEHVVALERKAVLEDNGFRIGQVGGITPAELQALLTSERSSVNPRRIQLHAGNPATVLLGPTMTRCRFHLHQGDEPAPIALELAQCTLSVVPTLTGDGRTKLAFTPQVHHGEAAFSFKPAADQSGWMLHAQRPTEQYSTLTWEVTLAPNEYVMVGARFDRPETLGHECFIRGSESVPVQRLLVIRTGRPAPGLEGETAGSPSRVAPLALQASWTAARGASP